MKPGKLLVDDELGVLVFDFHDGQIEVAIIQYFIGEGEPLITNSDLVRSAGGISKDILSDKKLLVEFVYAALLFAVLIDNTLMPVEPFGPGRESSIRIDEEAKVDAACDRVIVVHIHLFSAGVEFDVAGIGIERTESEKSGCKEREFH